MRILQIAPLWETVPPPAYGGTESVVSVLADGLVKAGHEVTLCAAGDSNTLACLQSVYPRSLRTAPEVVNGQPYDWVHAARAIEYAKDFDVIHNHAGELVMAFSCVTDVPMLSTMHCLTTPDTRFVWRHYAGYFNTISYAQNALVPATTGHHVGVVYNAIDVESFPFATEKKDYLLSLSRISPEKGVHLAIEAARRAGRKLIIAGKVDRVDAEYFSRDVEPLIDGSDVIYVGEADQRAKRELLVHARAVLMPICWEEPFGLVATEAMACGTPVIAFPRGALPELVEHGSTGFLVGDAGEMAAAVNDLDSIDPLACRRHIESKFDGQRMAEDYLEVYRTLVSSSIPVFEASRDPSYADGPGNGRASLLITEARYQA